MLRHLSTLLLIIMTLPAWADYDFLEYEITYQGKLSGNKKIPVTRAILMLPPLSQKNNNDVSLRISSEDYMVLETSNSFRLCHNASYSPSERRVLEFDSYLRAGNKASYIKAVFDWASKRMNREVGLAEITSTKSAFDFQKGASKNAVKWKTQTGSRQLKKLLLDRLTMFQHIRKLKLTAGQVINIPVSDGRRELEYWVSVTQDDGITVMGQRWDSFKLSFETYDLDPITNKPDHPPLAIWISSDNRRLPLRLAGNFPFGSLEGTLKRIGKSMNNNVQCREWPGFNK